MSANWSFFSIKYIFIYSVKRSRHNVWTLCINLIEFQLFLRLFWATKNDKQKTNSRLVVGCWSYTILFVHVWIDGFFLVICWLVTPRASTIPERRLEFFEIEFEIACFGKRGNFSLQLLQATKYAKKTMCFIIIRNDICTRETFGSFKRQYLNLMLAVYYLSIKLILRMNQIYCRDKLILLLFNCLFIVDPPPVNHEK